MLACECLAPMSIPLATLKDATPMSVSLMDFLRFKPRPVTSAWDWRNRTGLGLLCMA